jgi:hypothetical protein
MTRIRPKRDGLRARDENSLAVRGYRPAPGVQALDLNPGPTFGEASHAATAHLYPTTRRRLLVRLRISSLYPDVETLVLVTFVQSVIEIVLGVVNRIVATIAIRVAGVVRHVDMCVVLTVDLDQVHDAVHLSVGL